MYVFHNGRLWRRMAAAFLALKPLFSYANHRCCLLYDHFTCNQKFDRFSVLIRKMSVNPFHDRTIIFKEISNDKYPEGMISDNKHGRAS